MGLNRHKIKNTVGQDLTLLKDGEEGALKVMLGAKRFCIGGWVEEGQEGILGRGK